MSHSEPPEGANCMICYDDISKDNYMELSSDGKKWFPSPVCQMCIEYMLHNNYEKWMNELEKSDCLAEIRRMVTDGPPIYIKDEKIFTDVPDGITNLYFYSTKEEKSGLLEGAKLGEERDKIWNELKVKYDYVFKIKEEQKEAAAKEAEENKATEESKTEEEKK